MTLACGGTKRYNRTNFAWGEIVVKRLLSLLLAAALVLTAGVAAVAQEDIREIYDADGLFAIADAPEGKYRLVTDLDMSGVEWTPIPFSGELDGAGHGLYNLSVRRAGAETRVTRDGNMKEYETEFAGLFSTVENAEIRDLGLIGVDIAVETASHCFAGGLAGYVENSSFTGCTVEGRVRLTASGVNVGVGGLAGYGRADFDRCAAEVELTFEDRNFESRCEQFMGGVVACGLGNITNCAVGIDGYDSCHGFVHDGGLIGMSSHCGGDVPGVSVSDNSVRGQISFFEDNPRRRAYCSAYVGELLTWPDRMDRNSSDFARNETFDYSVVLKPERCETPRYEDTVTPPDCDGWGYTTHRCAVCGYTYRDSYTPAHTPGDWETAVEPTYDAEGLLRRYCTLCGALVGQKTAAVLTKAQSVDVGPAQIALHYKGQAQLTAAVLPEEAEQTVVWSSSDPSVVTVDENGVLYAVGRGAARVVCDAGDGFAQGECAVTVNYSFAQWLIIIFLFGWLWY